MKSNRLLLIPAIACVSAALAVPVQFSQNGHWYERIDDAVDWYTARAEAEARGGYLAIIESMDENVFLTAHPDLGATPNYYDSLNPNHEPFADLLHYHWLGGMKLTLGSGPADGWQWVDGTPFTYENWARQLVDINGDGVVPDIIEYAPGVYGPATQQTEPNNWFSQPGELYEDHLLFDHSLCPVNGKQWNDLNGSWIAEGYVVEWDQSPHGVPDGGSSILLALSGLSLLGFVGRRFRRVPAAVE